MDYLVEGQNVYRTGSTKSGGEIKIYHSPVLLISLEHNEGMIKASCVDYHGEVQKYDGDIEFIINDTPYTVKANAGVTQLDISQALANEKLMIIAKAPGYGTGQLEIYPQQGNEKNIEATLLELTQKVDSMLTKQDKLEQDILTIKESAK